MLWLQLQLSDIMIGSMVRLFSSVLDRSTVYSLQYNVKKIKPVIRVESGGK